MPKTISVKQYLLPDDIKISCVGEPKSIKALDTYFFSGVDATIEGILLRLQLYHVYCYPEAPVEHWRFLYNFTQDLASFDGLITEEQFEEAYDLFYSKNIDYIADITDEEYQQYIKGTYWYRNGWSV